MCCHTLQKSFNRPFSCFAESTVAEENGRKFTIQLRNGKRDTFCRVKIDGGIYSDADPVIRCDYVFYQCKAKAGFFVELKGKEIDKALDQIYSSIRLVGSRIDISIGQTHGCIVASRVPMTSVQTQVLKTEFKSKIGGRLEIRSRQYTWIVD